MLVDYGTAPEKIYKEQRNKRGYDNAVYSPEFAKDKIQYDVRNRF